MKRNGDIFECYSNKLYDFLVDKGCEPIGNFIHNDTKVLCRVFRVDDNVQKALKEWNISKPITFKK